MQASLWTEESASNSNQSQQHQQTAAAADGDVSPLQAAIDASQWTREDVELALDAAKTVLLALALYYGIKR